LLLGGWNAARVVALVQQIGLLLALDAGPDPRLPLAGAVLWALLLWLAAVALWQKRPFSRYVIPILLVLFALYEFSLTALYATAPVDGVVWLRRLLTLAAPVLFTVWALNRTAVTHYFHKEFPTRGAQQKE
jgi:hypothetical protein